MKKKSLFFLLPFLVGCSNPTSSVESESFAKPGSDKTSYFLCNGGKTCDEYELIFKEGNGEYEIGTEVEFSIRYKNENKVPYLICFGDEEVPLQESYTVTMTGTPILVQISFADPNLILDKSLPK